MSSWVSHLFPFILFEAAPCYLYSVIPIVNHKSHSFENVHTTVDLIFPLSPSPSSEPYVDFLRTMSLTWCSQKRYGGARRNGLVLRKVYKLTNGVDVPRGSFLANTQTHITLEKIPQSLFDRSYQVNASSLCLWPYFMFLPILKNSALLSSNTHMLTAYDLILHAPNCITSVCIWATWRRELRYSTHTKRSVKCSSPSIEASKCVASLWPGDWISAVIMGGIRMELHEDSYRDFRLIKCRLGRISNSLHTVI